MKIYKDLFDKIINLEHLFLAWDEFKKGKGTRPDVIDFEMNLEKHIIDLHHDLKNTTYKHAPYAGFYITDPKRRHVHKATVRDRILHHAIFNILNPIFELTYISYSFSCRLRKGNHKGVQAMSKMLKKESKNNTTECYVLKCDVKKFFDSIDHEVLLSIISKRIKYSEVVKLLTEIIESHKSDEFESGISREREREREYSAKKVCQ